MRPAESLRKRKLKRHGALKNELGTWLPRYQQLSRYILPFSGRYFVGDRNRGDKSFNEIYDSTATRDARILVAGLMSGMTSPARPWHRLAIADKKLMEREAVKRWLALVTQQQRDIFARSNTYRALPQVYEELGVFGTAANLIDPNFDSVIWNHPLTAGEYCISVNSLGRPDTLYREFDHTVAQLVEKFVYGGNPNSKPDWSVVSQQLKSLWDRGQYDDWVTIVHTIEPRAVSERDYKKRDAKNMAFASCYFEMQGNEDTVLRESGYQDFPGMVARWNTRGGDIYGNSPGMEALGDIKQLQHQQFRKAQAIDFMAKPPIGLPPGSKGDEVEYIPGGQTVLGAAPTKALNLVDVRLDLQHLLMDIQDVRNRCHSAFYADLFLMISQMQGIQPRGEREIAERHEEKLLMLGPVLERLHDELLAPLIDNTFAKQIEAGILPPPPPELAGADLKVEFVSTLAQAQKIVGLSSMDRLLGTIGLIAQGSQDISAWDKVDRDQVIDVYADTLAVDPSLIVADEKVALVRESRRQAQQAAQQAAMAQPMAQAAAAIKTLGETDADKARNNLSTLQGYT